MTAVENVALPLMFRGEKLREREQAAIEMLKKVGLGHRLFHYPGQMSGGQQQRVGIARAFVTRPEVIFADEPTGNLDTKTTEEIMAMITHFSRTQGQTVVLVTHDPEMSRYGDRIIRLVDGAIIQNELQEKKGEKR